MFVKLNYEYRVKYNHWTVVATDPVTKKATVYDGHWRPASTSDTLVLEGYRMDLPADPAFNINLVSEKNVEHGSGQTAPAPPAISTSP